MRGTCDGLVIKSIDYEENGKLITVLTADRGQLVMTVKGARSLKSENRTLCIPFTYANFEYYEKKGRYWLSKGSEINSFFRKINDLDGFAIASYISQLAAEITGENAEAEKILQMTMNTLYVTENRLKPYALIKSVYEAFAVAEAGFAPELGCCGMCERRGAERGLWLDVANGRLLCGDCLFSSGTESGGGAEAAHGLMLPIDESAVAAWQYVNTAPLKRIFSFELKNEQALASLSRATEAYIVNHLERSFKALEFYNTLKGAK